MLDASVAGQDVQPAKLIDYPRHHIRGLGTVGDISAKCRGLVALVGQLAHQRVGRRLVSDVVHRDCRTLCGQATGDRGTDASAATGDQCPLARQPSNYST